MQHLTEMARENPLREHEHPTGPHVFCAAMSLPAFPDRPHLGKHRKCRQQARPASKGAGSAGKGCGRPEMDRVAGEPIGFAHDGGLACRLNLPRAGSAWMKSRPADKQHAERSSDGSKLLCLEMKVRIQFIPTNPLPGDACRGAGPGRRDPRFAPPFGRRSWPPKPGSV